MIFLFLPQPIITTEADAVKSLKTIPMNPNLTIPLLALMIFYSLAAPEATAQQNIHYRWQNQLETFVSAEGKVNYRAWKKQKTALDAYILTLEQFPPQIDWPRSEILAFWINAYNALTVRLILEHYPIGSIRDLKNPWDRPLITLQGKSYTLNQIEHDILRKLDEPRIHFAINCASVSCPKLQKEAFMSYKMEAQLTRAAYAFLTDSNQNILHEDRLQLSRIFLWFGKDFGSKKERLDFIGNVTGMRFKDPKITFLAYDWRLNE